MVELDIKSGKEFASETIELVPDLYTLKIGEYERSILLSNSPVFVKGFLDEKSDDNTILDFEGTALEEQYEEAYKAFKNPSSGEGWGVDDILDKYSALVLATIVYKHPNTFLDEYETIAFLEKSLSEVDRKGVIGKSLELTKERMDNYSIGAQFVHFSLPDRDGKIWSTDDFAGKIIMLDFWASWCGPCRAEIKSLNTIYQELKGDDLVFISVSLDDDRDKWLQAMDEDDIPWVALWDSDGFWKSDFREQLGFSSIPFIILIDKEGRLVGRELRGEDVKNEIIKERNR